jgi:hypothetical protein
VAEDATIEWHEVVVLGGARVLATTFVHDPARDELRAALENVP